MNPRTWDIILLSGIVIGIIGCFLPWGSYNPASYWPWYFLQGTTAGTWIRAGTYTLVSLLFAATFQLFFMIRRKMFMFLAMLVATLIAFSISGTWILNPVALEFDNYSFYAVLYGAYVTQLSTMAVSATAFLYLALTVEKQLGSGKPNQITNPFRARAQITMTNISAHPSQNLEESQESRLNGAFLAMQTI